MPHARGPANVMKAESRILAFFFFLCCAVTNPYLLAALYSSEGVIRTAWVNGLLWSNTVFWILATVLAWQNKLHKQKVLSNALFAVAISVSVFQVLALLDRTFLPLVMSKSEEG